jgi:hypothetical protein
VQPHDREGPVEHQPGGFGAQPLIAPLADGQAELGGAGVLVDPDQKVIDGERDELLAQGT